MSENDKHLLISRNPANGQVLGQVPVTTLPEITARVQEARFAFDLWRTRSLQDRLDCIARFHKVVIERKDELARLVTLETGKPLVESYITELFGVLETCQWLSRKAEKELAPQPVEVNRIFFMGKRSYTIHEPLGVVAIISPWNFPFSIPVATMLTALAAGNTVVVKPSPKTPLIAQAIEKLFWEAGFPPGSVSIVQGDRDEARAVVLSDVDRVVFTGSVVGGKAIMSLAAEKLHPVTLELGGKHPAIVLEDAPVEQVAKAIVWSAFANAGQMCVSIERLYVVAAVAEKLTDRLVQLTKALRLGDGLNPKTDIGPVIDEAQLVRVQSMVERAVAAGAVVRAGGRARRDLGGFFYEPTALSGVTQDMEIARQEIFGPVLPIIVVKDEAEALALANDSQLGLGASVWTADVKRGERLSREINSGLCWVNDSAWSHACPDAPWGGRKGSGFGRTHSAVALRDFTNLKFVGVDNPGTRDWNFPYSQEGLDLVRHGIDLCHKPGLLSKFRSLVSVARNAVTVKRRK